MSALVLQTLIEQATRAEPDEVPSLIEFAYRCGCKAGRDARQNEVRNALLTLGLSGDALFHDA